MKRRTGVWIVEYWWEFRKRWSPTIGAGLDREQARLVLADWKTRHPHDRFRLVRYVAPK